MHINYLAAADSDALGLYLGFSLKNWNGGWVRHRECPACAAYDHSQGTVFSVALCVTVDGENLLPPARTRDECLKRLRCPACTHGKECCENRKGIFWTRFVSRDGSVRRFITEKEFAERIGRHYSTVHRWIAVGDINEINGLVRGVTRNFIDTQKCPLLRKRSRVCAKVAA